MVSEDCKEQRGEHGCLGGTQHQEERRQPVGSGCYIHE